MSEDPSFGQADIRPLVGGISGNRAVWIFASALAVGVIILFAALETRRQTITAPAIGPVAGQSAGTIASPPELFIPPAYAGSPSGEWPTPGRLSTDAPPQPETALAGAAGNGIAKPHSRLAAGPGPHVSAPPQAVPYLPAPYIPPPSSQPVYNASPPRPLAVERSSDPGNQADRVRASAFVNPATTVPKGTLLTAVLETALDSTRPGYARAIVSHDVYGFDGSRVLIPRGSRLVGEYKADLALGQKRALIQWQRLMRPDGAIINLDSPAADPLGRAGVEGKVNSHFFERFGGAILQSVLNIGTQVAASRISDGTIVYAVPVPGQALPIASPDKVQPTLKVPEGKSISVFVAKDLDFTTVER